MWAAEEPHITRTGKGSARTALLLMCRRLCPGQTLRTEEAAGQPCFGNQQRENLPLDQKSKDIWALPSDLSLPVVKMGTKAIARP